MLFAFRRVPAVMAGVLFAALHTAARAEPVSAPPPLPAAYPSLKQFAAAQGCAWGEFSSAPAEGGGASVGDLAWALVTSQDDQRRKQWCVKLTVVSPTAEEQRQIKTPPPLVLHSNLGTRLEFKNDVILLELRTAGPFTEKLTGGPRVVQKTARTGVSGEHLGLGFDRACAAMIRLRTVAKERGAKGGLAFLPEPFPADEIAKNKVAAERVGLTPEDEKTLVGSLPALFSFLQVALTTPGLQEILQEVLDVPVLSIVANRGKVDPSFEFESERVTALEENGEAPRYLLPVVLRLSGKPALRLDLIVTTPRPPRTTTAGIVSVHARHPTNPKKTATIEIISAVRPTGSTAPATAAPAGSQARP